MVHKARQGTDRKGQSGFSLLEMLVAVAILSAAAYVALDTVENDTGQRRYELTELRLEKLRRALVGDSDLVLNGAPVISGFVADVGRLPECLEALYDRESDCDGAATIGAPAVYGELSTGSTGTGLYQGWRGPYVTSGASGVVDGWGNGATGGVDWGWSVTLPVLSTDDFVIASLGRDRAAGASIANSYDEDDFSEAIITTGQHQVSLNATGIYVEIDNTAGGADHNVCIAVIGPDPSAATDWMLYQSGPIAVADGDTWSGTFSATGNVPMGRRPLIIYDADATQVNSVNCTPNATKEDILNTADVVLDQTNLIFAPGIMPVASLSHTF